MFDDGEFHIIPSVRDIRYLEKALNGEEEWILLSCVHIGNLKEISQRCHQAGKKVIVNHEIVGGLGADKMAFRMLKNMFLADGVMGASNTKLGMAKRENLNTIRRDALEDSLSVDQILSGLKDSKSDVIELRPAYYAVKYLERFKKEKECKYVAGGFVDSKEMVEKVYEAGFQGTMTSCVELWDYKVGRKVKYIS